MDRVAVSYGVDTILAILALGRAGSLDRSSFVGLLVAGDLTERLVEYIHVIPVP